MGWEFREGGLDLPPVQALVARHMAEARAATPASFAFVLDDAALRAPGTRFFTLWEGERLLGMGALKDLGDGGAELKSMRTHPDQLRRGVARAMVDHLVAAAREAGFARVNLETGTQPMFLPAVALYEAAGFAPCDPYGDYPPSDHNRYFTRAL